MGLRFRQSCCGYIRDVARSEPYQPDGDKDLISRLRVRMGWKPHVINFTRARIGREVLHAMNGDVSKLRLRTSGGVLTATSLDQGPLPSGNYDEENPRQKAFNGTLHRRRGKPLVGIWFIEVDPDGYVCLQRIWDKKLNATEDVYDVIGVEPAHPNSIRRAMSSRRRPR